MSGSAPSSTDLWAADSDRLRDLTKWIVASFGAIAVSLVAGSQLSDLGAVHNGARLTAAMAGLVVGLLGTLAALVTSVRVMAAGSVSLIGLSDTRAAVSWPTRRQRVLAFFRPPYGQNRSMSRVRQAADQTFRLYSGDLGNICTLANQLRQSYELFIELRQSVISLETGIANAGAQDVLKRSVDWRVADDREQVLRDIRLRTTSHNDSAVAPGRIIRTNRAGAASRHFQRLVTAGLNAFSIFKNREMTEGQGLGSTVAQDLTAEDRAKLLGEVTQIYQNARNEFTRIQNHTNVVVRFASNELVRQEFRRSLKFLVAFAVLTALGIGLFAWGAHLETPS